MMPTSAAWPLIVAGGIYFVVGLLAVVGAIRMLIAGKVYFGLRWPMRLPAQSKDELPKRAENPIRSQLGLWSISAVYLTAGAYLLYSVWQFGNRFFRESPSISDTLWVVGAAVGYSLIVIWLQGVGTSRDEQAKSKSTRTKDTWRDKD